MHRGDTINPPFVHAHINHLRAILDLLPRHGESCFVIAGFDQLREFWRTGDVRALADVEKIGIRSDRQRIESAQAQIRFTRWTLARRKPFYALRNRFDVGGSRAAAPADNVEPAVL